MNYTWINLNRYLIQTFWRDLSPPWNALRHPDLLKALQCLGKEWYGTFPLGNIFCFFGLQHTQINFFLQIHLSHSEDWKTRHNSSRNSGSPTTCGPSVPCGDLEKWKVSSFFQPWETYRNIGTEPQDRCLRKVILPCLSSYVLLHLVTSYFFTPSARYCQHLMSAIEPGVVGSVTLPFLFLFFLFFHHLKVWQHDLLTNILTQVKRHTMDRFFHVFLMQPHSEHHVFFVFFSFILQNLMLSNFTCIPCSTGWKNCEHDRPGWDGRGFVASRWHLPPTFVMSSSHGISWLIVVGWLGQALPAARCGSMVREKVL